MSRARWKWLRVAAWAIMIAWAALLVTLTHIPKPPGVLLTSRDKSLHFIAYSTLAFLTYMAASLQWPRRGALPLAIVLVGAIFAAIDESTQPFFGRSADIRDFQADMLGLIAGVVAGALLRRLARRLVNRPAHVRPFSGKGETGNTLPHVK